MPQATPAELGSALRKFRESRRLTGTMLSRMTGISQGHISELENGRRNLTEALICRIAEGCSIPVKELEAELARILEEDAEPASVASGLREMASPYNLPRPTEPPDDMHLLAAWLVGRMAPSEVAGLLRMFTEEAIAGDSSASARARALLLLINNR
jgi:transcriptional regulator with XRE-family HTH domain